MPSGTSAAHPPEVSTDTLRYFGSTIVTRCPSRASARGSAPHTSASPPVFANGRASLVTKRICSSSGVLWVLEVRKVLEVLGVLGVLGVLEVRLVRGARGAFGAAGFFGALCGFGVLSFVERFAISQLPAFLREIWRSGD